jgi:hypothetical protein
MKILAVKSSIAFGLFYAGLSATGVGLIAVAVIATTYGILDYTGHVDSAIDGGIAATKSGYRSSVKSVNTTYNKMNNEFIHRLKTNRNPFGGY